MPENPPIEISLEGEKITGWSSVSMSREIDSAANSFSFSIPTSEKMSKLFRPYSAGVIEIKSGDVILLRGYYEVVAFSSTPGGRKMTVSGRSASGGILEWSAGGVRKSGTKYFKYDGAFPLTKFDFQGLTLKGFAEAVAPFHEILFDPGTEKIEPISIEPGQTLFDVISTLASIHGYYGVPGTPEPTNLSYRKNLGLKDDKTPEDIVARIDEETSPIRSLGSSHDVTKRNWGYLCIGEVPGAQRRAFVSDGKEGLGSAIRGIRIIKPDQDSANYEEAAKFARSRALIDSYKVSLDIDGLDFISESGQRQFWQAGDLITLKAPSVAVYEDYAFIIKKAVLSVDVQSGAHTTLDLGFKELYSGGHPEVYPWGS